MTSCGDVLAAVQAALVGKTDVGTNVVIPGDLPTQPDSYPIWKVRLVSESKTSMGRNSIGFTDQATIRIMGEVSEPVDPDSDMAVNTVTPRLLELKKQAERAIINSMPLFGIVQQLLSVNTQFAYAAQATRLAGIQCDYTFEFIETAEDFFQFDDPDLAAINATDPNHPGVGLTVDAGT